MAKGGLLFEIRKRCVCAFMDTEGATPENPIPTWKVFFFLSSGPHQGPGRRHGGRKKWRRKAGNPHGPSGMNTVFILTRQP